MSLKLSHLVLVVVSVSVLVVAAQSFQASDYPSGERQGGSWIRISGDQAIGVVKGSGKVDPKGDIVRDEALESIKLSLMKISWPEYLVGSGRHDRLYISSTPTGTVKPYWVVEYLTQRGMHDGSYGKYIVDAETGELMLAFEDYFGPPGPGDFSMSFDPPLYGSDPFIIDRGETRTINVRLTAYSSYDASLPLTLNVTGVPKGISVSPKTASGILRTNGTIVFKLDITASPNAEPLKYLPWLSGPANWISLSFKLPGYWVGKSIKVEIPES